MTTTYAAVDELGADEPRARFHDLVAAEWIKLRSLRSTWIAYGATALAVIAFNAGTAYDTYNHWPERSAADRADFVRAGIPLQEAFTANAVMVMMLALGAIGAVAILGEYSTGTIRTTFAAVPARRSVMAAKTVVVTAVSTVFGAIVAAASFGLTQAILDGRDAGLSIGYPGALRVVAASALLAPVCALMRHGDRLRHQAHLGHHGRLGGSHSRTAHGLHRRPPLVGGRRARHALPGVVTARGGRLTPDRLSVDDRRSLDRLCGVGAHHSRARRHQRATARPVREPVSQLPGWHFGPPVLAPRR